MARPLLSLPIVKFFVTEDDGIAVQISVKTQGSVSSQTQPLGKMRKKDYREFIRSEFHRLNRNQINCCPECGRAFDGA